MSKQLLIYEQVRPITGERHKDWSIKMDGDYEFARSINSVPLVAAEFPNAAAEYTIVFAGDKDNVMPVAIMGLRDENLYLNESGGLTAKYVPAFLRRYPFIFSSTDEESTFTLCIDESFSGCNQKGRGERLFDSEGEQTQYLSNVLEFLKEYQAQYQRTEIFGKKLNELNLLEPMSAQFTMANGEKVNLSGFMAIDRDKLKELSAEQLKELAQTDELELAYIHIQSMKNFSQMLDRFGQLPGDVADQGASVAATESENIPSGKKAASTPAKKKAQSKKAGSEKSV